MSEPTIINPRKPHLWWNQPWTIVESCTRCSDGCKECWALGRLRTGLTEGKINLRRDRLAEPLHWRKPRVVFPLNDVFHEDVDEEWIPCLWAAMALAPQHTFLVLTKRAERMARVLDRMFFPDAVDDAKVEIMAGMDDKGRGVDAYLGEEESGYFEDGYLSNVWLGVTCEHNGYLHRVEELVRTPAAVRWVNAHLLGPLYLRRYLLASRFEGHMACHGVHWLAIECNRPFHGDPAEWWGWCKALVEQAVDAEVPVWVKQGPLLTGRVTHNIEDFPPFARRREFPTITQKEAESHGE